MRVITLTTDFGQADWFVGSMKGVILSIEPRAVIVDVTHGIPPGNIHAGAFALRAGYRSFPRGSVHVVVVDPGVGGTRKAIAVQTKDYVFISPDNGVLSWALANEQTKTIRALENERYFRPPVSRTFHGRDIFAPVAARLASGLPLSIIGPRLRHMKRLDWPGVTRTQNGIAGEVIYIDRFGNGITTIQNEVLRSRRNAFCEIQIGKRKLLFPLRSSYDSVPIKSPVALPGSTGFLEIAINGGSAEQLLGLKIGMRVSLRS